MMIVADAMPSSAASITPVWAKPWSSDCRPVSTRSNASSRIAGASASATAQASAVASASSSTWMARSAPRASASRSAWRHAGGAGRADHHFAAVLLLEAQALFEGVGVGLVQLEGGVLVADPGPLVVDARLPVARRDLLEADGNLHGGTLRASAVETAQEQGGVGAAEPEGVGQRVRDRRGPGLPGHVVQVALRVGRVLVDGRRHRSGGRRPAR